MRAIVTGSMGFSGRHLAAALAERGIACERVTLRAARPGVRRVPLGSAAAWARVLREVRPDVVFHLHGAIGARGTAEVVEHNALAAAALLDGAEAARCEAAILLVGSAAEYGPVPAAALPVTEDFPAAPAPPYGIAKHAQTLLGLAAARRGLRVVVARPANLVGPGAPEATALGRFARELREVERGERAPLVVAGDLDAERDLVDVRDAVRAYVALALAPGAAGRVVNVSTGRAVRIGDALARLVAAFGLAAEVRAEPERARPGEPSAFAASPERLRELTGAAPVLDLDRTLRDIVREARETGA
jgi:GDP-4-dehydro-6-deoxy-D-mannose reductase